MARGTRLLATLFGGLLLAGVAGAAGAHSAYDRGVWTPGLDRHQAVQEGWQRYGAATGRITPREAHRIDRAQAQLRRHERRAEADGVLTPRERSSLGQHAHRLDRAISREYYDHQRRGWRWGW
jgi:hypothetical protein